MSTPIRILDTGLAPARWNVAMTAALVEAHGSGAIPDTLRFHRYRPCVLIGHGQQPEACADLDHCHANGIEIARRVTGGGAVYMSPGMLAWDVAVGLNAGDGGLARLAQRICEGVACGLSRLGVRARYRAPHDIEIGGRKVSGSSGHSLARSAVLQGTVLVDDESPAMAAALRIPAAVLRERVTCLFSELGSSPALEAVRESIASEVVRSLGRCAESATAAASELNAAEVLLRDEIGREDYVMGGFAPRPTGTVQ